MTTVSLPPAIFRISTWLVALAALQATLLADDKEKPITPIQALEKVDQEVFVELKIVTTKDRLEKRGEIYLDSQADFRDRNNLAIVITREGAESLQKANIKDPAAHFKDKKIRVRGKVIIKDDVRRIEINEARQIELVKE